MGRGGRTEGGEDERRSASPVMDSVRATAEQRDLLVATIRDEAEWRRRKADQFCADEIARKRSLRARQALRTLANFVEGLPDTDPDLKLHALRRVEPREGKLRLTHESVVLLSRFGLKKESWQSSKPSESQMRNVLRRLDGIEGRERAARKQRAELGYGDD